MHWAHPVSAVEPGHDDMELARRLGERLRTVRVQKSWSLRDVQLAACGEFSAAAVGSYERGERLISVPRLNRLASLYSVPLEELLPREAMTAPVGRRDGTVGGGLVIDLSALDRLTAPEWEPVRQFSRAVQARRDDFNGRVLTIRAEDARSLALVCGHAVDELERLLGAAPS
jgi:transcriptional regulator with XRE-family HTH domain